MIKAYLRHWWRAGNAHGLHSPFVYALYTEVISARSDTTPFTAIEQLRKQLRQSTELINVTDLGAGSRTGAGQQRQLGHIARSAQKPVRYAQLLNRLVHRFKPTTVLELGTSLGLTTAYLADAAARTNGRVVTFEGCPAIAAKAKKHLDELGYQHVDVVVGDLSKTLASELAKLPSLDFVFFDANHRYQPTIQYFTSCLEKAHNDSLFIFDDIHWSDEMEQAWATIKDHPSVQVTVDLFGVGLVFFRRQQPRQHFVLTF
ncbi:O-methyltransferase-like protein [Fibrella aestuarina BUZ 2]|uniref:O-methyltransferase-like protein n=1 Tax=Fibrella aestuarina BUZ 2 TaxID=1166018 RepID=I0K9A3_9BACT|nr:class I SAM-dependent methyltransferase [Fibrella aestuarina]CCH00706.1 O-methyltransferase-like protein [Fibrella aestuarina BUZ 2]